MITTSILSTVDNERLQRGVIVLTAEAYSITLTCLTETEICAYVDNGDGKTYSITLTEGRSFCDCADSMFHGKACKHSVALALHVIRIPQVDSTPESEAPSKPLNLKIAKVRRTA